jgi:hypothetical protein
MPIETGTKFLSASPSFLHDGLLHAWQVECNSGETGSIPHFYIKSLTRGGYTKPKVFLSGGANRSRESGGEPRNLKSADAKGHPT